MRQELIIAIFVGIFMGLIVTFGVYTANKAISKKKNANSPATTMIPTPEPTAPVSLSAEITTPQNNLVVTNSSITLQGLATPYSTVVILTEDDELFASTNASGHFSQKITLIKGINVIEATATDSNQLSKTVTLNLVYSTNISLDKR